jgi:DNA mismatch repair protein MutH
MLPTGLFTASNKKPIKYVVQTTLSIKSLMFELKEIQNNQGHSLNLQYISIIPLRVAVGVRWTAAFFFFCHLLASLKMKQL